MTCITGRAVLPTVLLLILTLASYPSTAELLEHKGNVDSRRHDAEVYFLGQMPLTPLLSGNNGSEASGASLLGRHLLGKRQCPAGSGFCRCKSLDPLQISICLRFGFQLTRAPQRLVAAALTRPPGAVMTEPVSGQATPAASEVARVLPGGNAVRAVAHPAQTNAASAVAPAPPGEGARAGSR